LAKKKTARKKIEIFILSIVAIIILNYVTGTITDFLGMPFFLDTWATSLGVITRGFWVGTIGGVLYNLLMALTAWKNDPLPWIWAISSIWIAASTYIVWKWKWVNIEKPGKVLLGGLLIGFTNAIITTIISLIFFGGLGTHEPMVEIYRTISPVLGSGGFATFLSNLVIELADKTVSLFLAAIVFSSLPKKIISVFPK